MRGSIERPARARCPLAVRPVLSAPLQRSDEPAVMPGPVELAAKISGRGKDSHLILSQPDSQIKPTPTPLVNLVIVHLNGSLALPCTAPTFTLTRRYLVYLGPNLGPFLCICVCFPSSSYHIPRRRRRRSPPPPTSTTTSSVLRSRKGPSLGSHSDVSSRYNRFSWILDGRI